jgi:DNA-binding PadR family transcriptional regulator
MHLDRLEKACLITGQLELSEDGKAMKYYDLSPFELRLDARAITDAVHAPPQDTEMKETASEE